jgi:hypothetical protein
MIRAHVLYKNNSMTKYTATVIFITTEIAQGYKWIRAQIKFLDSVRS